MINWEDFEKVEMRAGTILEAEEFKEARNPSYKLLIDFGDFGRKRSSAQITENYTTEELIGKQVIAVTNFPPKQIANMMSECLITGLIKQDGSVILAVPEREVENGLILR